MSSVEYHKIRTVWKRDSGNKNRTLIEGAWACDEFEYLARNAWEWTEKVDGMNIRVAWDGNAIHFGGKTDRAQIPATLVARLEDVFLSQCGKFAELFPDGDTCLYGEGYGAGIQKGGKYLDVQDFVLFDVRVGDWWLRRGDVADIANKLAIRVVPIVGIGDLHRMIEAVRIGLKSLWGDFPAEGIVARPLVQMFNRRGERIITKVKTKDFA